jgi:hypothetical protein
LQDLSNSANDGWPSYGESEAGGNTMSADPAGKLPSTESEQSSDIDQSYAHGDPNLQVGDTWTPKNRVGAHPYSPTSIGWTTTGDAA